MKDCKCGSGLAREEIRVVPKPRGTWPPSQQSVIAGSRRHDKAPTSRLDIVSASTGARILT
jgi:hypothetical protein